MFLNFPIHAKPIHRPIISELYNKLFGIIFRILINPKDVETLNIMFENIKLEPTNNLFEIWISQLGDNLNTFKEYSNIDKYYICLKVNFLNKSPIDIIENIQINDNFVIQKKDHILLNSWKIPAISSNIDLFDDKYNEFYNIFYKENINEEASSSIFATFLTNSMQTIFEFIKEFFFIIKSNNQKIICKLFNDTDLEKCLMDVSLNNKHIKVSCDPSIDVINKDAIEKLFEGGE